MVTVLGDLGVFWVFLKYILFYFGVYNNPVLEAKQSRVEALRHIKFILSTAVRGDSLPASEY